MSLEPTGHILLRKPGDFDSKKSSLKTLHSGRSVW
jgi:hypothetical protein